LAEKFGGMVVPFTRWHEMLTHVDIVIASVSGGELLLNASAFAVLQKRRANSLFIIDLGVPRNIDPKIGGRENVFLYDLDGLQTMVDETLDKRRLEIPKVEALIAEVLDELRQWYSSLEVNPTITALTQFMEHIRAEEVAAQINRFEPHDRELVELVTRRIINKIIHAPIVNLRNGRSTEAVDRRQKLLALQKLFGLAPSPKDDTDAE
jgi:glutamyl-tRNA reductase